LRGFSPGNRKAISREADFANAKSGRAFKFEMQKIADPKELKNQSLKNPKELAVSNGV